MEEIARRPWNGFNVVTTFSGGGGSTLGYRMAGFKILWASEFVEEARKTYLANASPGTILDSRDIRKVTPEDILGAIRMKPGEIDLLDGSPPCASFSTVGNRSKDWGKSKKYSSTKQRTDDLFFEFNRILNGLQPKAFVAENVSGLVKGAAKGYFLEILAALKSSGYRVQAKVLDAQWLGVPQTRQRVFFVGVRNDIGIDPEFPKPLTYQYTIADILPLLNVVHETSGQKSFCLGNVTKKPCLAIVSKSEFIVTERIVAVGANDSFGKETWQSPKLPAKTIGASPNTGNGKVGSGDVLVEQADPADISRFAIGKEWDKLKPGEQSEKYFQLVRAHPDKPSGTITASGGSGSTAAIVHPTEKRKFYIEELKRIGGFPDDFILTGSYAQQWERIGRSVPPIMMWHIASVVRDKILRKI